MQDAVRQAECRVPQSNRFPPNQWGENNQREVWTGKPRRCRNCGIPLPELIGSEEWQPILDQPNGEHMAFKKSLTIFVIMSSPFFGVVTAHAAGGGSASLEWIFRELFVLVIPLVAFASGPAFLVRRRTVLDLPRKTDLPLPSSANATGLDFACGVAALLLAPLLAGILGVPGQVDAAEVLVVFGVIWWGLAIWPNVRFVRQLDEYRDTTSSPRTRIAHAAGLALWSPVTCMIEIIGLMLLWPIH
jgi:hypothetical protein